MKNYFLKKSFSRSLIILTGILFLTSLISCSKKNDDDAMPKGKTAKFTITVNGILSDDYLSFVVSGGVAGSTQKTLWKINSVTQENETVVGFDKDDFTGSTKTYVIESVVPVDAVAVGIQALTFNHTYTVSYKAEINGEVKNETKSFTVAKNTDFTHDYTY